jgi:hypothetical protein
MQAPWCVRFRGLRLAQPPGEARRGLDSLYVGCGFDLMTGGIDFEDLEFRKEQTKVEHGDKFAEITLGTERFALMPYGRYPYRYILNNNLFELSLAEHMYPGCRVQFYSKGLWHLGLEGLTNRIDVWRRSLDLVESRADAVSRVDWAFDFHLPVADFTADHFVTRASKDAITVNTVRSRHSLLGEVM